MKFNLCSRIYFRIVCSLVFLIFVVPVNVFADILEEVIVTAKKREESLQDVSISITAFSGEEIKNRNLITSNELGQYLPGVQVEAASGNQFAKTIIRGSGSVDFAGNSNTTVGVYTDEVYMSSIFAHTLVPFDMQRVEVLRGPQGTLYGRNATAGAINYITNKPEQEFHGYGTVGYGNYDAVRFEGAVTGGVTENLSLRVAGTYQNDDGWMEGRSTIPGTVGGTFNDTDQYYWRGMALWTPQENIEILFNVHGSQDHSSGFQYQQVGTVDPNTYATDCDATVRDDCINFDGYRDPDGIEERGDPTAGDFDLFGPSDLETLGGYIRIDWDFHAFRATSITAYDKFQRAMTGDDDGGPSAVSHNIYRHETRTFSEEVRLTSTSEGPWEWIVGLYYATEELPSTNAYEFFGFITYSNYKQESDHFATFANLGYQVNDLFKVYGGLRYTRDEFEIYHSSDLFDPPYPVGFGTGLSVFDPGTSGERTYDDVTWKVGVDFTPTDDLLVYAHVGTGYKSGGINVGFGDPAEFNIYDEETILAVESGFKSTLFDGRAQLNISGFYYDYEDLQVFDNFIGSFGNLLIVLGNADQADYYGMEAELKTRLIDRLDLNFGVAYLDTEFKEFTRAVTGQDLAGHSNVYAPEWKFVGNLAYEWPLQTATEGTLAFNFDWSWTDEMFHTVENHNSARAKARWLVGARLSYRMLNDKIEIAAWGRNLSNTKYRVQTFDYTSIGFHTAVPNRPRTYGIEIGYNW